MQQQRLDLDEPGFWKYVEPFSVYKTSLYEVKTSRAGEIRFGPEYKFIEVYSKGVLIWDGGKNIYGEESFAHNVIGEKFDKLILIKWFSQTDPREQAVVEINLATGRETKLDMNQRYWEAGHFNSFDGAFYRKSDIKDYLCKDFEAKTDFLLFERINEKIQDAFAWTVTSIKDCIMVYAKNPADNAILYNIRKKEIVDWATLDIDPSVKGFSSFLDKVNDQLMIRCHYYDLDKDNRVINSKNDYFRIRLK